MKSHEKNKTQQKELSLLEGIYRSILKFEEFEDELNS